MISCDTHMCVACLFKFVQKKILESKSMTAPSFIMFISFVILHDAHVFGEGRRECFFTKQQ